MIVAIHQPEFLPWLGLIDKIRQADVTVLLDNVQYEKNYFQNRNRVRTADGWAWITTPVRTRGRFGQAINDVEIDYARPWQRKHLRSLVQHYSEAPHFNEFFLEVERIYGETRRLLVDLNIALLEYIVNAFGLRTTLIRASSLPVKGRRSLLLADICATLQAQVYLSGVSGREYLDEKAFREAGSVVRYQQFSHPVYPQRYNPFVPQMSSIDLLFNVGPAALRAIEQANSHAATI